MPAAKQTQDVTFSINRAELARELDFVASASEQKTTIPILSSVKAQLRGDGLHLVATSMDSTSQSCVAFESGFDSDPFCVELKRFRAIVQKMKGEEIKLGVGAKLLIQDGKSKFTLDLMDAKAFPDVETVEGQTVTLPTEALSVALALTRHSIGVDERTALDSLRLKVSPDAIQMVGSDAQKFACAEVAANTGQSATVAISRMLFSSLDSLLSLAEDSVDMTVADKKAVKLSSGNRAISGRLTTKESPTFDAMLDAPSEALATIQKDELIGALDRLMVVILDDSLNKSVKAVDYTLDTEELYFTAGSTVGDGVEFIEPIGTTDVLESAGRFNAAAVMAGIAVSKSESLAFGLIRNREGKDFAYRFASSWVLKSGAEVRYQFIAGKMAKTGG